MSSILPGVANLGDFMPHGMCLLWRTDLLLLHVVSDLLIAAAYYSIPAALAYFVIKRKDLQYPWLFVLFAIFILACGTTHVMAIWTIWHPDYVADGVIKLVTAITSVSTAVVLCRVIPQALRLVSPAKLVEANEKLQYEIGMRTRTEEALRASEERWKFALEGSGDGVWDYNFQTHKVLSSRRYKEMYGLAEHDNEDVVTQWEKRIHPDDKICVMTDLRTYLDGDASSPFSAEYRMRCSDGSWKWILDRAVLVSRTADGKPLRMIGTHTDITERKLLQMKQLMMVLECSSEAVLLVNKEGFILFANDSAVRLFGYAQNELVGCSVDVLVPLKARPGHGSHLAAFMSNPKPRPMATAQQLFAVRKDGSEFSVEVSLSPIEIDNQVFVITGVLDITERKRLEREMQLAAMVYRAIGEAIMVADADNRIVAVNPSYTRLTGYTEQEAVGQSTKLLKSGRHTKDFYWRMWQSLEKTGHWQGEIWNQRKNGEAYLEWLVINTVYDDNGAVLRRIAMFSDVTDQKRAEQTIWQQANFDPLTGLPNRRMFHDRLEQEIKKAHRSALSLALLFLDLDRFKEINDTLGHAIGDLLLKEVAQRISGCVRDVDTVARLGGDEFTVILSEIDDFGSIARVAQGILRSLAGPFQLDGEILYESASIGITLYPDDAATLEELLKNADQAMYAAKHQGRNCYSYFTSSMQEAAHARMRLIADLRSAMAENQLLVYYQPIVELATGAIHKAEALIRWRHPVRGFIAPSEFIPVAEEVGMIVDIGDWVFREAIRQTASWRLSHDPVFQVSINKSPVQFLREDNSHGGWADYLKALGLPGQVIVIEITEGLLLETSKIVADKLLAFRDAGVQVALDDFGTGYSSLSYLKKFDIDYIKIDQSFISNLAPGSSDMALSEAIIVMAHKLGLKVIAEGVETAEQRDLLIAAGCDYGQGYWFSRPVPAEEFEKLL
ncbi:sensor domain-containing protein [Candidatus Methylospira mobilis]|nr:EAL domain-containing protein [Candidatus Methylospira mobilis]